MIKPTLGAMDPAGVGGIVVKIRLRGAKVNARRAVM